MIVKWAKRFDMKNIIFLIIVIYSFLNAILLNAQSVNKGNVQYWNSNTQIGSFRLPPPPMGHKPEYIDLNGDGKPDAIKSMTHNNIPILWLDDDGNMTYNDLEGDTTNDCLLIDRNRDGIYGGQGDLIIKWTDLDGDGIADIQFVMEYPATNTDEVWPNGHYMIVIDTDKDNIFNYINWNTFKLECWEKSGISDFYPDYSGQTAFMKMHASTYDIDDLRLNWENPFLFYDEDGDGLTEMAIRLLDSPPHMKDSDLPNTNEFMQLTGKIDWVSIAVDLDNDNRPGNEFDFDFTIGFQGPGFDYSDQVHKLKNMRGLPEADQFFMDSRFRKLTELIYPAHDKAYDLIFKRGVWNRVNFVFDEDDDCGRWERVEFCDNKDPFKVGRNRGGFDNHSQADPSGDRGEWDMDNSGGGKLYISRFDGRLHLYGAENGIWRIDQNTKYYQGWDRQWMRKDPEKFATVCYTDRDNNGFIDYIEYDLDGDHLFETIIDLKALGIDDRCELIDISEFKYKDFTAMMDKMSESMWNNAKLAEKVAEKYGLNTSWYAKWKQVSSIREKYHKGYWLQFYIYKDLEYEFMRENKKDLLKQLHVAYYSSDWNSLLN